MPTRSMRWTVIALAALGRAVHVAADRRPRCRRRVAVEACQGLSSPRHDRMAAGPDPPAPVLLPRPLAPRLRPRVPRRGRLWHKGVEDPAVVDVRADRRVVPPAGA